MSDSVFVSPQPLSPLTDVSAATPPLVGEQFLRLHLVPNTPVLLPLRQLVEVLSMPSLQIVPIPHMPAWVIGAYNWRGDILWMVDLGHLCGLTPWYAQATSRSTQSAVILRISDQRSPDHPATHSDNHLSRVTQTRSQVLGLVVDRIGDVEWCRVVPNGAISSRLLVEVK
jgi:positive phototaxis protein PixI